MIPIALGRRWRRLETALPMPAWRDRFGIRSWPRALADVRRVLSHLPSGDRYGFDLGSAGMLRPDLSLPAYAGFLPTDGLAPIFNFFDRTGGGRDFRVTVTRSRMRDHRGGRLSYDEHDGTDFVCPPGTPLAAAAPGVAVAVRDTWLRGGLTLCVDHGHGVVTQYTHLARVLVELGQPVARGEAIALSGHSGYDMTQFFPWVPPHVHFMVWVRGRPVDPYRAAGEPARAGLWADGNSPRTAPGPHRDDPRPDLLRCTIDGTILDQLIALCRDDDIHAEMARAPTDAARAALVEDSVHHDRPAWPEAAQSLVTALRPGAVPERVALTLPLPASLYVGARAADTRRTRPPA